MNRSNGKFNEKKVLHLKKYCIKKYENLNEFEMLKLVFLIRNYNL